MKEVKYACAFCGEAIESVGPDIGALILVANWNGPTDSQQEQQFFCHADCFRGHVRASVPICILDGE
jgi:hypothetical protein